jgi:hypothetical protein
MAITMRKPRGAVKEISLEKEPQIPTEVWDEEVSKEEKPESEVLGGLYSAGDKRKFALFLI